MEFPYLHNIVTYLHSHLHFGLLITFFISFAESLAIIGAIIPGSVTMTAIGMLVGSGVMPLTPTLLWAIAGAFLGDLVSFWIGSRYNTQLRSIWPFRSNPQWLVKGEAFFRKHGGKSVVFGRFFGPVRSAVPLIAGLMQMSTKRFILAALPSAAVWAIVYIGPGILVGQLSLELPPHVSAIFILTILSLVAFGWIFFLLIHHFLKKILLVIDRLSFKAWHYCESQPATQWITQVLGYPTLEKPYRQLSLLLSAIVCGFLFIWVFISAFYHISLAHLNQPVFIMLRSLRTHFGENFMILGTLFGEKIMLLPAAAAIALYLLWKRYIWAAFHWIAVIFLSTASASVLKHLYHSPRPPGLLIGEMNASFPSGHTILSVAVYGFLAFLIAQSLARKKQKIPYIIATLMVGWVGFSRLYLGAHWLTDVLASITLAMTWVLLGVLSYRSFKHKMLPYQKFSFVSLGIILVFWGGYTATHFRSQQFEYTLYWPTVTLSKNSWWAHDTDAVPLFVLSRLGSPTEIVNVQWLGNLSDIESALTRQGWESYPIQTNFKGTLHRLSSKTHAPHLPLLPALYQNQAPALLLTKTNAAQQQLNLMLWKSNVTISDSTQTLWLGSLHYYMPSMHKAGFKLTPQQTQNLYSKAIETLIHDLKESASKILVIIPEQQPIKLIPFHWDGKILMIQNTALPTPSISP